MLLLQKEKLSFMKLFLLLNISLIAVVSAYAQTDILYLQEPRYGAVVDAIEDTLIFIGGADESTAEYFTLAEGVIDIQDHTDIDGFSRASIFRGDRFSVIHDMIGINIGLKDRIIFDKQDRSWIDLAPDNFNVANNVFIDHNNVLHTFTNDRDSITLLNLETLEKSRYVTPFTEREFTVLQDEEHIYCIGGKDINNQDAKTLHIYDLESGTWSTEYFEEVKDNASAVLHNNQIIALEGNSSKLEVFDLETKTSTIIQMESSYLGNELYAYENRLIVAGGSSNFASIVDLDNLEYIEEHVLESQISSLYRLTGTIWNDKLVLGGEITNKLYVYNFTTDNWTDIILEDRKRNATLLVDAGNLLVVGGEDNNWDPSDEILVFEDLTSYIDDFSNKSIELGIHPNPTPDRIFWSNKDINVVKAQLYNNAGNLVFNRAL